MLTKAMCYNLIEIFKGSEKNRKVVKIIVDSLQEQLFKYFFSESIPQGIINRRSKINSLKVNYDTKEKNILNALDRLLGEYEETFSKSYIDHELELKDFINDYLRILIKSILEFENSTNPELWRYLNER